MTDLPASAPRTVLAIDLSTPRGVIAVLRGDALLYEAQFTAERSHNAQVFAPLGQALEAIGDGPALIAVGTGPGSYTGVRIAIAAAQGVALSRGWPVLGWSSLTTAPDSDYSILGDARRGMYYVTHVQQHRLGPIEIIDAATAQSRVEAQPNAPWFSFDAKVPLNLPGVTLCQPDAVQLARIVTALPESEVETLTPAPLEPMYLQEAFITTAKKAGKKVPV